MPEPELRRRYLRELFDATVSRDVLQRYRVRNAAELAGFANLLASSFSRRVSIRRMSRAVGLSEHTLTRYAGYLEEACLVLSCPKYSMKARETVRSIRKYYLVDPGFVAAKRLTPTPDVGLRMENVVAVELVRRGFELYYYLARDRYEADFVLVEGKRVNRVVQVSHDEAGLREREVQHGIMAAKELGTPRLDVITWLHDGREMDGALEVTYIPLWKWLLQSQRKE
jgi:predicted AAA+ superfamily ATPase